MIEIPDEITFDITEDDVINAKTLISNLGARVSSSCAVAIAVNRWLKEHGITGHSRVSVDGINIWTYHCPYSHYEHSQESRGTMIDFDMGGPVRPCVTTIRKAEISKEMK